MSVQLAPQDVLERIAQEYAVGGRYADRQLPQCSRVAAIVAADPRSALNKKIASIVANGGASASKMLRVYTAATDSGLQSEDLKKMIINEANRLIGRALTLSARHGAKARVRLSTLSQLSKAGFIDPADLGAVKVAMMSSQMVSDLISKVNGDENLRWKLYRSSASPELTTTHTPGKARRGVKTAVSCRKKVGMPKAVKPLSKAAYLKLSTKAANDKAYNKAQRQANAKLARKARRGNGKAKHSVGESPMCIKPLLDLCAAGHVGVKVSK